MTQWENFNFEDRIHDILQNVNYYQDNHHFGRPFLTAYQIALEFARRYPDDFHQIDLPIGGKDTGQYNTLAQYIAGQLSRRKKAGALQDIEGSFISNNYLSEISFKNDDQKITSSLTNTEYDLSIFRLKEKNI